MDEAVTPIARPRERTGGERDDRGGGLKQQAPEHATAAAPHPSPGGSRLFRPGQSGNPRGRPRGSRHRIAEGLLRAVAADFEAHGAEAVRRAREADAVAYLRVVAGLLPKRLDMALEAPRSPLEGMDREALLGLRDALREAVALARAGVPVQFPPTIARMVADRPDG